MKLHPAHLSIAILAIGGSWLFSQGKERSELQTEISAVQKRLHITTPASSSPSTLGNHRPTFDTNAPNWPQVLSQLASNQSRNGIFKTNRHIEEQLRALSASSKLSLTERLLSFLLDLDPGHIITNPSLNPEVAAAYDQRQHYAMINWTRVSPDLATAWFDSQPTDAFSPQRRKEFQLAIFNSLFVVDFPQAKARLLEYPQNKRQELLLNYNTFGASWTDADVIDQNLTARFAQLARIIDPQTPGLLISPLTWLGEQDRPAGISAIQESLKNWDTIKSAKLPVTTFTDYLRKIDASPAEIAQCIDAILAHPDVDLSDQPTLEPHALRTWLAAEVQQALLSK